MSSRTKAIIAGIFFSVLILIGGVVAVLIAFRQNTTNPVAPTVPQITPHATGPTTTPACTLTFTVTVTPTPTPTPTPNPVTYKYKKCETTTNNAKACKEEDCVPRDTPCAGLSSCTSDADCQPKYQHKVCLGNACSVVDCSPVTTQCADSCSSNIDCAPVVYVTPTPAPPQATHYECKNKACVLVAGAGTNMCTSDVSCQPAAVPPPIPKSGNTAVTIGVLLLGIGAVVAGALILL